MASLKLSVPRIDETRRRAGCAEPDVSLYSTGCNVKTLLFVKLIMISISYSYVEFSQNVFVCRHKDLSEKTNN